MSTLGNTHVAHQFDDAEQQLEASTLGMWIFLCTEILFFGGMFAGYAVYRESYPAAFHEGSVQIDLWLGAINTGVLLTSSLTMALAVHAVQSNQSRHGLRMITLTMLLGVVFLGIKSVEYARKFEEHHVPGRHFQLEHLHDPNVNPDNVQLFFSYYFAMTGMHAVHMIIGLGMMTWLLWQLRHGRFSSEYYTPVEMTGLYWHFVDIIWVFLFPLFYLIR